MKLALRNFAGNPVRYFLAEKQDASKSGTVMTKTPSHHICILDVSGSMWGDLDAVKSTVE